MSEPQAHLLVADDDERIRGLLQKFLIRNGFLVTTARDAAQARRLLAGLEFDMLILDVMMPGMDGPAMVRAIRAKLPHMPVLFMSGYAEEQLRRDIDIPDMHFIAKPFSVASIGDKVGAVLREARAAQATEA